MTSASIIIAPPVPAPASSVVPTVVSHALPVPANVKSTILFSRSSGVTLASGVKRTFGEIAWLRQQLVLQFPGAIVPRLPTRAVSTMLGVEVVATGDSHADKCGAIEHGSVADDFGAWFEFVAHDSELSQSAIVDKFVSKEPMSIVKAVAATVNKSAPAALTRGDSMRLAVFKLVRELRITSWNGAPTPDGDVERQLATHKACAAHMVANAKLLLANATQAVERRLQLADAEAKLARNAAQIVAPHEAPHDELALATLQSAALAFSAEQAAASSADRAHALAAQQKLVPLRLWLGVALGYADAVERMSLARDTAHFVHPLLAKSAAGTPRAAALDALVHAHAARAAAIAHALTDAAAPLQNIRTDLMTASF